MNDKAKKPQKLRARLPRGLADRGAAELAATRRMTETIRAVYERYGFEPVETPAFEYTDALGKFLPDQDRPNEGVFSFQDDDEQWVSLRYDLTAPLARYVAENWDALPKPYRSYRAGYVYRNEKPGPGRFRQFMQFDADTVGSASPAADAEMCMMAADAMEALGLNGQYVVKVNDRKIIDGVLETIGITDGQQKLTVFRAIDKLDKFSEVEIRKLLGVGRWDGGEEGKGDFTKGASLTESQIRALAAAHKFFTRDWEKPFSIGVYRKFLQRILGIPRWSELIDIGFKELDAIRRLIRTTRASSEIRIDPSVVRGLEYYTGAVFEVELLLETKDEKGRPVRFGSVGGGGRYDGLVSRFRGEVVPATGFSIGVSRLQAALELLKRSDAQAPIYGPVVVTVFDNERIADYQKLVKALRDAPIDIDKPDGQRIRAELYLGNPKNMGNQLKYADKRNSPCVIIQGSNEFNHESGVPHVIVKDLIIGNEVAEFHAVTDAKLSNRDFRSDQKAQAQHLIPFNEMVGKVRELLAKHEVKWG